MSALLARFGVIIMLLSILVGPWFSLASYRWLAHTTSELGGQSMPNAWIMNTGFFCYGIGTGLAALLRWSRHPMTSGALVVFSAGLIGAALFSSVPISSDLPASLAEDWWHSVFSSLIGFAFSGAAAIRLFAPGGNPRDALSWTALFASVLIPLAMFRFPEWDGLLQRCMFGISLVWVWRQFPSDQNDPV